MPVPVRRTPRAGSALTQGTFGDGMAYLCLGAGQPLVFLPGLSAHHRPPHGMDRWFQLQQVQPFGCHREVWWIQRRAGLTPPVTMADLANDYAGVLAQQFGEPVDVMGVSTGGSVALQLAADHPGMVRRPGPCLLRVPAWAAGPRGTAQGRGTAAPRPVPAGERHGDADDGWHSSVPAGHGGRGVAARRQHVRDGGPSGITGMRARPTARDRSA